MTGVLGIVAHDLRNPVGTIQMTADLLLEDTLPEDVRKRYYGIISRATNRMKHLIRDLLDVTNGETASLEAERMVACPVDEQSFLGRLRELLEGTAGR